VPFHTPVDMVPTDVKELSVATSVATSVFVPLGSVELVVPVVVRVSELAPLVISELPLQWSM
jgi:hypothetical protein